MPEPKPKSLFAPLCPKIDTALADRLIAQAEASRQAATPVAFIGAPVAPPKVAVPAKKANAPRVAPVRTEPFTVTLELEIINELGKSAPCWGYIRAGKLGIVLNRACEPTTSALATRDLPVLKWLVMLGLVTRLICQHRREPRMNEITKHLWRMVERPTDTFWDSPGVSYRLARHPISEGLEKVDWDAVGPQPFGSFVVGATTLPTGEL